MNQSYYNKAVIYAQSIVGNDLARDLVHDLYLNAHTRGIDLFNTSKRFIYVALHNYNRSRHCGSMKYRHGVQFVDYSDYEPRTQVTPHDVLVEKERRATLDQVTLYKVEGYNLIEIAEKMGVSKYIVKANKGERKRTKLTEQDRLYINDLSETMSYRQIAKAFKISRTTVKQICECNLN